MNIKQKIAFLSTNLDRGLSKVFERFHRLEESLRVSILTYESKLQNIRHITKSSSEEISNLVKNRIQNIANEAKVLATSLGSLNPNAVLKRGYSLTYTSTGKVIKTKKEIKIGHF